MDLQTDLDRLPSPFTAQQAEDEGAALGLDAGDVAEALEAMRRHELVSDAPEGNGEPSYVKHAEAKNWFWGWQGAAEALRAGDFDSRLIIVQTDDAPHEGHAEASVVMYGRV